MGVGTRIVLFSRRAQPGLVHGVNKGRVGVTEHQIGIGQEIRNVKLRLCCIMPLQVLGKRLGVVSTKRISAVNVHAGSGRSKAVSRLLVVLYRFQLLYMSKFVHMIFFLVLIYRFCTQGHSPNEIIIIKRMPEM